MYEGPSADQRRALGTVLASVHSVASAHLISVSLNESIFWAACRFNSTPKWTLGVHLDLAPSYPPRPVLLLARYQALLHQGVDLLKGLGEARGRECPHSRGRPA